MRDNEKPFRFQEEMSGLLGPQKDRGPHYIGLLELL
jgi:hypothetical protein